MRGTEPTKFKPIRDYRSITRLLPHGYAPPRVHVGASQFHHRFHYFGVIGEHIGFLHRVCLKIVKLAGGFARAHGHTTTLNHIYSWVNMDTS